MKKLLFCFLLICASIFVQAQILNQYHIIPKPMELIPQTGMFKIDKNTLIIVPFKNVELVSIAESFAKQFETASGIKIKLRDVSKSAIPVGNHIYFMPTNDNLLGNEGYKLEINSNKITLQAKQEQGFFYALQTLFQLFPPQIFSDKKIALINWSAPCVVIKDVPRFVYRGLHLDVCRNFFPVSFIKKYIDLIAFHKLNTFHWHLTDDQGWRIEIKKYPKLTEIGSKRKETIIGHPHHNKVQTYDGKEYGGFYTQEEIKEVVAYAKTKYVTVIPEIEMPGHASAALAAYPELSCDSTKKYEVATTWGIFEDIFCPSEKTFTFLENVLTEVITLFPSNYIHIGGDEAPKTAWKKSVFVQNLIKKKSLKDEHGVQSYFISRIEKFLNSKGRQIIGWDEILEGGLAPKATVMSWRGISGGVQAARQNHDVIMSPSTALYLDYYQDAESIEPLSIGGFLPLEKVYAYEPVPEDSLTKEQQKYILGTQSNVWSEYLIKPEIVEYMVYPRASAFSEVAWSQKKSRNWNDFAERLPNHLQRLGYLNVNYAKSFYSVKIETSTTDSLNYKISLIGNDKHSLIKYTVDGKDPDKNSISYTKPFTSPKNILIKAASFKNGNIQGKVTEKKIN